MKLRVSTMQTCNVYVATAPPCHIYTAALRAALVHRQGRACALSRQACARPALPARAARAPLAAGPAAPPPPRHGASSPHWAGLLLSRVPLPVPDRTPPCDACTHPAPTAHRTGRPYSGARWPTRCARPSGPRARRGPRASSSAAGLACHPPQRSSSRGSSATRGSTGPTCVRGKGQSKKKRPLFFELVARPARSRSRRRGHGAHMRAGRRTLRHQSVLPRAVQLQGASRGPKETRLLCPPTQHVRESRW